MLFLSTALRSALRLTALWRAQRRCALTALLEGAAALRPYSARGGAAPLQRYWRAQRAALTALLEGRRRVTALLEGAAALYPYSAHVRVHLS
jgi:hypothetical protein